jgi:hypothetical protein
MMRPPRGVWVFIIRKACVQGKAAVRLTAAAAFQCSAVISLLR